MDVLLIGGCGYIGSSLFNHLKERYNVQTVDLEWYGNFVNPHNTIKDFAKLTKNDLGDFDVIVLLAGHSSVQSCKDNRMPSFENNLHNFVSLLDKIWDHQRFIYASSSSIYGNKRMAKEEESCYVPQNYYDLTKRAIDLYAMLSHLDWYGLRFGTVNGPSPNLRAELMLNKMYRSGREDGIVKISNPQIARPILGIHDLCAGVERIIETPAKYPGIYNLASFNGTVESMAQAVADITKAKVEVMPGPPSYDFSICTGLFSETYKFEFKDTVQSIVASLDRHWSDCHLTTRERQQEYEI